MKTITWDDVLRVMREVVAEFGEDYVYQLVPDEGGQCLYVHRDEDSEGVPGCIVAQVLHRLGVPLSAFDEGFSAHCMVDRLNARGWGITYVASVALAEAQRVQDSFHESEDDCTWGAAYRAAVEATTGLVETTGEETK